MDKVRLGVIGLGAMGAHHASYIAAGEVSRCELTAVFDIDENRMKQFPNAKHFTESCDLISSGEVDAVLIATPHYSHTTIGIDALKNGLHVLIEKPISVHKADAERLIAAHTNNDLVFAAMFNVRTVPQYAKVKKLIDAGELGELIRVTWIVTDWFRTDAYYASSGWRGTWAGEGGGVLLNQCPHQLDLLQWICGMPKKIRSFCGFGVRHDIEVEDQVTAYLEFANNATGVFISSTGETPGTNRLEIAGELGKVMLEGGKLSWIRNEVPALEFSRTTNQGFGRPDVWNIEIPTEGDAGQHKAITQNFIDAVLDGTPVVARAEEGIKSVELANAMLYSTLTDSTVELPMDSAAFEKALTELITRSVFKKETKQVDMGGFGGSFTKA